MRRYKRHINRDHSDQNQTAGPDAVKVEPRARQEFQAQPEIDNSGDYAARDNHGPCVHQRDRHSGPDIGGHELRSCLATRGKKYRGLI